MKPITMAALALALGGFAPAAAQEIEAGPLTLDFTGRAQVQLHTTSLGEDEIPVDAPAGLAFETRRMRLGAAFAWDDFITGSIEADFAGGGASLTDALIDLAFSDAFAVTAGQQKKPFGLFELTSNTKILTIERTARIRGLEDHLGTLPADAHGLLDEGGYLGRDIGVLVHGALGRLGYAAGVFNGEGPNAREALGSKAYAGRLTLGLTESLTMGAALSRQPTAETGAAGDELVGTAWAVEAEFGAFRAPGLHVMAELMGGDDAAATAGGEMPSMRGAHAAAGWFVPTSGRVEGIEPVLRASWADPDTGVDADEGLLVTPGLNLYFTGRNRFMVNGDVYLPAQDGLDPQLALVAQLQIYF